MIDSDPRAESEKEDTRPHRGPRDILLSACWFGLVVGLLELALLFALKPLRDPVPGFFRLNRHAVWMIPTADLLFFLGVGLPLALMARYRPVLASRLASALFAFLGFFVLLLSYPRLYVWACLILGWSLSYRGARRIEGNAERYRRLVRRSLLAIALGALMLAGASIRHDFLGWRRSAEGLPQSPSNAPNVLLIVLDTVRADRLSVYGYQRRTTPNLEQLAQRGIRFTQARSTAPWTLPSHASMLTGRWPHELSAGLDGPLDATFPTLAEYLASRGYATGGFVANLTYTGAETGLARGFLHYDDHDISPTGVLLCSVLGSRILWPALAIGEQVGHPDELPNRKDAAGVGRSCLDWLEHKPEGRPFFAFLNYFDAHNPYLPPSNFLRRLGTPPRTLADRMILLNWFIRDKKSLSPRQIRLVNDAYDDCLAYLDEELGHLFHELDRRGHLRNTLLIVTADHGEHFGEHGLFGHASSLYDQEIRVPLIVIPPGGSDGGQTVDRSVTLRDLPATIVDLAGLKTGAPFPGRSLARYWRPESVPNADATDPVLSEVDEPVKSSPNQGRSPVFRGAMKSLVTDREVYILNGDGVEELYDVQSDPGETQNLVGTTDALPLLRRFRGDLQRLVGDQSPRYRDAVRRFSSPAGDSRKSFNISTDLGHHANPDGHTSTGPEPAPRSMQAPPGRRPSS